MAGDAFRPRWGQPWTGIAAFVTFFLVAWGTWYVFSDPRGPVGMFPYPFVMYLAMMILVGLWQHMFLGDWPFQNLPQPMRGVVETVVNLVLVWFVIHVIFDKVLGLGFNFLSQANLNDLAAAGKAIQADGTPMAVDAMKSKHFAQSAVVSFVLIGFYSYPFVTILFGKWPIRPSDLTQPRAGLAEIGWCSFLTVFFYTILIVPFWGATFGKVFAASIALNVPWWNKVVGFGHLHWVFGFWEWMIIVLFMTANVWRGKPWSAIPLPQPWKGTVSFALNVVLGYAAAVACVSLATSWLPAELVTELTEKNDLVRFLWYHAAEIAGMTLMPFLIWHHYFDDKAPMKDLDSWGAFGFRTLGVLALAAVNYYFFYYLNWGYWGLGNEHMHGFAERFTHGESLVWNFWWIIPLLWNEWFFHKWPFYVHESH